jgi:hypothetical protein
MRPSPCLDRLVEEAEVVVNLSQLKECDAHGVLQQRFLQVLDLSLLLLLLILVLLTHRPLEVYSY